MVPEVNLLSPLSTAWGAAKSGRGQESNPPPPACCVRLPGGTRETPLWRRSAVGQECGGNAARQREATEASRRGQRSLRVGKPRTRGGGRTAQAPRLCAEGNTGPQCTRQRSTGGHPWNWSNGHRRSMVTPWRPSKGVEPGAVKAARPVLNGGDEEMCRVQRALSLSNYLAAASRRS